MVPGRGVVAGPGDGVALASGIGGASHDEWAFVGIEFEHALVGAARVLHAVDIVDFGMCRSPGYKSGLLDAMDGSERHGLAGAVEDGGLVHVVPEAGEAVGDELLVERAPPGAGLLLGEVGKDAGAGPDDSGEDRAVGIVDEVVAGDASVVGRVALVGRFGDVKIGDGDGVEVLCAEIGEQLGHVGEGLGVDGEGTVPVLKIDVEPQGIGRDVVFAEAVGDFAQARLGRVAVAALLIAERPERRQRRRSGEPGVVLDDLLWFGAVDEVVVERAAFGAEGIGEALAAAEVEAGAPGVIEEDSVAHAAD